MRTLTIIGILFLVLGVAGCSSGPNMKEGKWEISTKVEMKGLPMQIPAMTMQQCLTKDDLIPKNHPKGQNNCSVSDQKINGDTVSWKVTCKSGASETASEGSITYKGETFDGTINVAMNGGPISMKATTVMSGKYIGPCD